MERLARFSAGSFFFCDVCSILASGIIAMVQMIRVGRVAETFRNMWTLLKGFFVFLG